VIQGWRGTEGCSVEVDAEANKKGTLNNQSAFPKTQELFFHAQNCVLGSLGDPELHDLLGLDLDRFTSSGIAADTSFAIDQDDLAETWNGEAVLGIFVGQFRDQFQDFNGLLFRDAVLLSNFSRDL